MKPAQVPPACTCPLPDPSHAFEFSAKHYQFPNFFPPFFHSFLPPFFYPHGVTLAWTAELSLTLPLLPPKFQELKRPPIKGSLRTSFTRALFSLDPNLLCDDKERRLSDPPISPAVSLPHFFPTFSLTKSDDQNLVPSSVSYFSGLDSPFFVVFFFGPPIRSVIDLLFFSLYDLSRRLDSRKFSIIPPLTSAFGRWPTSQLNQGVC